MDLGILRHRCSVDRLNDRCLDMGRQDMAATIKETKQVAVGDPSRMLCC